MDVLKVLGCISVSSFSPFLQSYCLAMTEHQILHNSSHTQKARGNCAKFVGSAFFFF